MNWGHLDLQMELWSSRLRSDVKLSADVISCLATTLSTEIRSLPVIQKDQIKRATPIQPDQRLDELKAFQGFMDLAGTVRNNPFLTRAQVIVQNYICFVYLPESCFRMLAKVAPSGSTAKKCAKYLTNNPVRAFRNAVAHGNWTYREDYGALVYWARKGDNKEEPMVQFEVDQECLGFWQHLARCVAYVAFSLL